MNEPDKIITDPTVQLIAYGVSEKRIKHCSAILTKVTTQKEFDEELERQEASYDWSQALMPVFRPLYQNEPDIRAKVLHTLATTTVPDEIIDEYFTQMATQPYLVFHLRYEDKISLEIRDNFNASAAQVILDTVKSYLGLMPKEPQV